MRGNGSVMNSGTKAGDLRRFPGDIIACNECQASRITKMTTSKGTTPAPDHAVNRPALTNMQIRILAGIPWLVGALLCLIAGEWPWAVFITLGAVVGVLEFYGMAHGRPEQAVAWVGVIATLAIMVGVEINQAPLWLGALAGAGVVSFAVAMGRNPQNALKQTVMTLAGLL